MNWSNEQRLRDKVKALEARVAELESAIRDLVNIEHDELIAVPLKALADLVQPESTHDAER